MKRCFLVVIDSLGVGEAPDAKQYGDKGVNTLVMSQNMFKVLIYPLLIN